MLRLSIAFLILLSSVQCGTTASSTTTDDPRTFPNDLDSTPPTTNETTSQGAATETDNDANVGTSFKTEHKVKSSSDVGNKTDNNSSPSKFPKPKTTRTTTKSSSPETTSTSSSVSTPAQKSEDVSITTTTSTASTPTGTNQTATNHPPLVLKSFNLNYLYFLLLLIPIGGLIIGTHCYCKRKKKKKHDESIARRRTTDKTRRFSTPSWVFSEPDFDDEEVITLQEEEK